MSGDIEKILKELSGMKIPSFFGPGAQLNKYSDQVATNDSMSYTISALKEIFADSVGTSEKILFKPRFADGPFPVSETVKVKSRSGDLVLLQDLAKLQGTRQLESSSSSDLVKVKFRLPDSAVNSDALKSLKVVFPESVSVSDLMKKGEGVFDSAVTSDLLKYRLKVLDFSSTSDSSSYSSLQVNAYPDSAVTSDLLKLAKILLRDSSLTSDISKTKLASKDPNTVTSELLKVKVRIPESVTTSDLLKLIKPRIPESPTISDLFKVPGNKYPDTSGSSDLLAVLMDLGTELETSTDVQASYIVANSLTNGHFDTNLVGWTTAGNPTAPSRITSNPTPKFGAGALRTTSPSTSPSSCYVYQDFTSVTTGIVYLDFWVYVTTYTGSGNQGGHLIQLCLNGTSTVTFRLVFQPDAVYAVLPGPVTVTVTSPLPLGAWHHVRCAYDITNLAFKVYLNGAGVYTNPSLSSGPAVGRIYIGDLSNSYWSGTFTWDEIIVGAPTTQGTSLTTFVQSAPKLYALSFDSESGYESSGSTTSGTSEGTNPFGHGVQV